ncbi:recombinase family protein [Streptomyces sp. DH10]|uniref:recombinase family protein n=1 Tax=Streptomyces sp. DH10 TaxID=3040121 RepID=UPI0024425DD4|nr:recombinase family protein [Streptomyces sp. DH10]MDG9713010.1 recombinase family protein [Streptomyces sp. DH10]
MTTLRALSAVRLSVLTDETTSPERQTAANEESAAFLGAEIIGEAVDLGVSASKTTPFTRPALGSWLTERADEFDVLCYWRFDRAIRSMADLNELVQWARDRRKVLVFAEGPGGRLVLDFRNGVDLITQLILQIFAFAAEFEAQSIRERVSGAQTAMRTMELRWRGGRPFYGYAPKELEGSGWTLGQDSEAVAVLERIIRDLFAGKTANAIAADLNEEGIPSPRDHWALKNGRKTGGKTGATKGRSVTRERFSWRPAMIPRLLRNTALLGWKTHDGNPVRDANGEPIMATTEPILTREEFDAIGALLDSRKAKPAVRRDTKALLLGVIVCDGCGGRAYLDRPKGMYKCGATSRGQRCGRPINLNADWAEKRVEDKFLTVIGGLRVTEIREIPGYDPAPEIAATLAEFKEHQEQKGRQRSNAAAAEWQRRADALDSRLAELESREKVEPKREAVPTDRTYSDEWRLADVDARREMLHDAEATFTVNRLAPRKPEHRTRFKLNADFYSDAAAELAAIAGAELAA